MASMGVPSPGTSQKQIKENRREEKRRGGERGGIRIPLAHLAVMCGGGSSVRGGGREEDDASDRYARSGLW